MFHGLAIREKTAIFGAEKKLTIDTVMKRFFIFILCILPFWGLAAQTPVTVKGKLISLPDREGMPYATVTVTRVDAPQKPVKKFATAQDGTFSTTLVPGKYQISFYFVGMNELKKNIEVSSQVNPLDLGIIEMNESAVQLNEVRVVAQRPLVKVEVDKLTYSAKDDPDATTSSVLDLLRKVPLVTVDGEDNIRLKGPGNFKFYLNGKPSNMISGNPSQVLKGMPANSVKDIEVITDPGAKYDAEGVGGIINLVTERRADDGYTGSVGANGNTLGGYGGNAYLTTKYGKFGFTGNGGYYNHRSPDSETGFVRTETLPAATELTRSGTGNSHGGGLFLRGTVSFEPDTLRLFNLSASRFGGKFYSSSDEEATSTGMRAYTYHTQNTSMGEYGGMSLSADYQRSFKRKGEMLTASYRFEQNPNNSEFESSYDKVTGMFYYPDGYRLKSKNDAGGKEHTGQFDYVNPLNGKQSIEGGLKYIFRDNSSRGEHTFFEVTDKSWKPDPLRKNDLDHTQHIASGYAGYGFKTGKFGLKLGVRGEYTRQEIRFMSNLLDTVVHTRFFDLVPSVALSYQLGMTRTVRGGYNMRISRPGIWYLNPYINDMDPNNIRYGNPKLDAEQQHNFNLNYGSFSQKLNYNITLSYAFSNNAVSAYSFLKDGVTHNTYENIGRNRTVGTNLYANWSPVTLFSLFVNGGVNYINLQSTEDRNLRNSGFSGFSFAGMTVNLPQNFRLGANGGLFMNQIELQTQQSPFYFYSFSMTKSFLDKKLDISLNGQNLFAKYVKITRTTEGDGFWQQSVSLQPRRNIGLRISYRFGDLKTSMKRVQRTISNEDVMKGGSSQQNDASGSNASGN